MTTTLLSSIAGSLLSLLFSYLPGLSDWYAQLGVNPDDGGTRKRLLMLALLCLTALASFWLGLGFGRISLRARRIAGDQVTGDWKDNPRSGLREVPTADRGCQESAPNRRRSSCDGLEG